MERDRTGWDRKIGREGGKRICMDGQAFWEWESPGFLLVFRSLSPIILWVCSSSFFQQFKNSPSFDLCYYTALFFFGEASELLFCASPSSFYFYYSYYYFSSSAQSSS